MVPQFVRRRYSTMFNGQPPFAFEHTDDRQDPGTPPYCSKTPPPGLSYHENPFQGYAPHAIPPRPVALDHDQVVLHRITPQDVVPALSPSPKISPIKAAELASEQGPKSELSPNKNESLLTTCRPSSFRPDRLPGPSRARRRSGMRVANHIGNSQQ